MHLIDHAMTLERARLETGHGYSLVLLGAALDHARPALTQRRNRLQAEIQAMRAAVAGDRPDPAPAAAPRPRKREVDD